MVACWCQIKQSEHAMEIHLIQGQISRMTESDSNTESLIYYLGFQLNACMLSRARLVVCVCFALLPCNVLFMHLLIVVILSKHAAISQSYYCCCLVIKSRLTAPHGL